MSKKTGRDGNRLSPVVHSSPGKTSLIRKKGKEKKRVVVAWVLYIGKL